MTTPSEQKLVQCPTCGRQVEWTGQQRWRPFCSERCKLIDLGEWLDETRRIPGEVTTETEQDTDA
jgi:endogenous inhibitor of DNA gyrase (YacG/DUF329 family)